MAIFKRGGVYWFDLKFRGERYQRSTRQGDRKAARQIEATFRTALAKGEVGLVERKPVPLFSRAMRDFLEWSKQEHHAHPATHARYVTSSVALLRFFKETPLDRITPEDVEKFKADRGLQTHRATRRRLRPATVNRELACLKALFNLAIKGDVVLKNPVQRVKFLAEDNEQIRVLTFDEQRRYFAAASQPLRDVAGLLLETGMRPEEVYRLRIDSLNLEAGYLFNPYGKTRAARRRVTLTEEAAAILKRRVSDANGSPYVFPGRKDAQRPVLKLNNAHYRALEVSKVVRFRLYDLRHTWATRAAMSGIDLVTLAAMLGHSRIQMVLRYAHPTEAHQAEAMRKMEQFTAARAIAEYEKEPQTEPQSLRFSLQ